MEHKNILELSDTDLKHLYDILLATKLTTDAKELLLIKMGKAQSPVLDMTLYVATIWETRAQELQKKQEAKLQEDVKLDN